MQAALNPRYALTKFGGLPACAWNPKPSGAVAHTSGCEPDLGLETKTMGMFGKIAGAAAALTVMAVAGQAAAATYTFSTGAQSGSDGPINGQAVITTGANTLTIAL